MKEEDFLKEIEETQKELRKAREIFGKILPKPWMELVNSCSAAMPEDEFQELVQKTQISLAEAREGIIKVWDGNIEDIFSSIKKQFQPPINLNKIEKVVPALADLLKDAIIFVTEELRVLDVMEEGLKKATKKE